MSMLIEKRNELVAKLNSLEAARENEINAKVADYRAVLEAQYPTEQIDKVKNVISALDEVINYDTAMIVSEPVVETIAEPVQDAQPQHVEAQPRPGMSTVFTPSRN